MDCLHDRLTVDTLRGFWICAECDRTIDLATDQATIYDYPGVTPSARTENVKLSDDWKDEF